MTEDTAAPTGGSVAYPSGYTIPAAAIVNFVVGTDATSGIGRWYLERQSAINTLELRCIWPMAQPNHWHVGKLQSNCAIPRWLSSCWNCYRYRLVVEDNVLNTVSYDILPTEMQVDIPGVKVIQTVTLDVVEGGATDTYDIVLNTPPTGNVTIGFSSGTQLNAQANITFTSADWNLPQTITVSAFDDAIAEGTHTGTMVHTAASTDSDYNGIAVPALVANITDNDSAGINVTTPAVIRR